MALKGELSDLSLAELIEFFCNQRKTGRLTVSYPQAPAYFYLQSGSVVHASVGSLRGIEAVYYALTQSNASFNFSTAYEAPAQTINQPWTSVVLEGLRRMDEGIKPRNPIQENEDSVSPVSVSNKPEPIQVAESVTPPAVVHEHVPPPPAPVIVPQTDNAPSHATMSSAADLPREKPSEVQTKDFEPQKKQLEAKEAKETIHVKELPPEPLPRPVVPKVNDAFLSSAHQASRFSHSPWKLAATFAALVLVIAGIAVPWGWRARGKTAKAAEQQSIIDPSTQASQSPEAESSSAAPADDPQTPPADSTAAPNTDAAEAARRARELRAREEARQKAAATEGASTTASQTAQAPVPSAPAPGPGGPRKAVVTVTYDENGRVTQASGNDPTALRIARQKRFPPGKAGSTTITIPIN